MRTILISIFAVLTLTACGDGKKQTATQFDPSTVYVYYFHGKQRCKTCITVENLVKKTVENEYSRVEKVKYVEVKTDDSKNSSLVEKHQVTWNALIVTKGNDSIDITKDAFANAVKSPEMLTEKIKTEVNKHLE